MRILPGETTTTAPETTTTLSAQTKPVTVYYTLGSGDELSPLTLPQLTSTSLSTVAELLSSPPVDIGEYNLRTAVPHGLILAIPFDRNVAVVGLDPTVLDRMSDPAERRAIAQMVLTFTSFTTPTAGNVSAVRFQVDGEPYEVFVPALGGTGQPDQLLVFSDFSELIATGTTAFPTTETSTTGPGPDTTAAPTDASSTSTPSTSTPG